MEKALKDAEKAKTDDQPPQKRQKKQPVAQKMMDHAAEVCSAMPSARADEDFALDPATEVDTSKKQKTSKQNKTQQKK